MIAIYARVSTEDQAKNGFSLNDQLRSCRTLAGSAPAREYVDEGVSGETLDRPALTALRKAILNGEIDEVICLDPDRLSRKLMNQLLLSDEWEKRVTLRFVNGAYQNTPEGQLFYQMRGAISQFEKAKINERMARGRREKAKQGRVLRDFSIYGYRYDRAASALVIDEREAAVVRLIFSLFTSPTREVQGINGIARFLNDRGIPTKRGAPQFHRQVVRQILMNQTYIGLFYQNRWNAEGKRSHAKDEPFSVQSRPFEEWIKIDVPPIISRAVFELAQAKLAVSKRQAGAKLRRHTYLLSGLLRCAQCGNTLTGHHATQWGKRVYTYTDRKHTEGAKTPGCGLSLRCDRIDDAVWWAIKAWLEPAKVVDTLRDHRAQKEEDARSLLRESLRAELMRIDTAYTRMVHFLEDPACEDREWVTHAKKLGVRKRALQEQLAALENEEKDCAAPNECTEGAKVFGDTLKIEQFLALSRDAVPDDVRQAVIRAVVREIRLDPLNRALMINTW